MSDTQEKEASVASTEEARTGRKSGKGALIGMVAIVVVIVAAVLFVKGGKKIDLNKYATIVVSGYDTVATARIEFDRARFIEDYGDKMTMKTDAEDEKAIMSFLAGSEADLFIDFYVKGSFDKSKGLSNGDKIVFSWDIDEDRIKKVFGYKVTYKDIKMTVKDLEEIATFDPFEGVEVVFEGTAPNGSATVKNNSASKYASKVTFKLDKTSGLSNGDVVIVSVNDGNSQNPTQYFINLCEAVPSVTEKEFTVSGLSAYVTSASQIPEENMETMKKQASDVIRAYVAKNWSKEAKMDSLNYAGNYFLSSKTGSGSEQNAIFLVYKAQATIFDEKKEINDSFEFYTFVRFSNMLLLPDGKFSMDVSSYSMANDSFSKEYPGGWFGYTYTIRGYELLDTLFNRNIATVIDRYNYEENISE